MNAEMSDVQPRLKPQSSYSNSFYTRSNTPNRTSTPAPKTYLRTEGYTAVDPYAASISHSIINLQSRENTDSSLEDVDVPEQYSIHQPSVPTASVARLDEIEEHALSTYILAFICDTLPRLLYSYLLLRLPSLYFSRVAKVFEDADLTMPEIKRMALELANVHKDNVHQVLFSNLSSRVPTSSPLWTLKTSWESFIESLLREWKTLNIISVLLLSAILTMLQIDSAAADPFTRYSALLSLISALMSLLYGCIFIIRFGGMMKPHKAAEWAWEARRTRTMIWWNVWVMLAMPAIWLSWSVVAYMICIMGFVWRSGSTLDGTVSPLEPRVAFWPRVIISLLLALGITYFVLISVTLSRYGSKMDRKWRDRVRGWTDRLVYEQPFPDNMAASHRHVTQWQASVPNGLSRKNSDTSEIDAFIPTSRFYSRSPSPIFEPLAEFHPNRGHLPILSTDSKQPDLSLPVQTFRAIRLGFHNSYSAELPRELARDLSIPAWAQFLAEIMKAWNFSTLPTPQASVLRVVSAWNENWRLQHVSIEAILCQEYYPEWPESPSYAIYMVARQAYGRVPPLEQRFGSIPPDLIRLDILDFSDLEHRWFTLFPERGTEVHFKFSGQDRSPIEYRLRRSSLSTQHDREENDIEELSNDNIHSHQESENDTDAEKRDNDTRTLSDILDGPIRTSTRRPPTPLEAQTHEPSEE